MIIKPLDRFFEDDDIINANCRRIKELENILNNNISFYLGLAKNFMELGDKQSLKNIIENNLFLEEIDAYYIDILIKKYNSLNLEQKGVFLDILADRYINKRKKGYMFSWAMYII